jgi:hypothetical protein
MAQQKMRYTDRELSLIQSTFRNNEKLLQLLRKVFLQETLTKEDINGLDFISNSAELLFLMKKTYAPEIDIEAPLGQVMDLWNTVDTKEKGEDEVYTALKVRARLIDLIKMGLQRLEKPKAKGVVSITDYEPDFTEDPEQVYVGFSARNALITHTEFQLLQLQILAGKDEETVEQMKERLLANSSK